MVAALGDVLEKVLIDFGKLFQRIGAVRLYERLDILREEVVVVNFFMQPLKNYWPAIANLVQILRTNVFLNHVIL